MRALVERLVPARLGKDYRYLWLGSTSSNLADGILLSAGPLLVASVTREPVAVAMAVFVQRLPWLLFGVLAGALIDRVDRRRLLVVTDIARAAALVALALSVATGVAGLPVVYGVLFAIGTAETFADNASSVMVAVTVPTAGIGQANARVFGSNMVANQLLGPPLGAFLVSAAAAFAFGANAVLMLLSAALLSRMGRQPAPSAADGRRMRADVVEGLRWLLAHPPVRTLAIMITAFNITYGAAFSVWVLYAYEHLGLDEIGFGVLTTASALGGLVGSGLFGWLEQRFSYTQLLRVGLVIETVTHFALAVAPTALFAGAVMALFGVHATIWGTTAATVRQRAVPSALLGRVTSVYLMGSLGAIALGTLLGGALGQRWGVLAPFWFAGIGSAVMTVLIWGALGYVGRAAEVAPAEV